MALSQRSYDTTEPDDSGLQVVAQPEAEVGELVSFFQYVKGAGNGLRRTRRIALVTTACRPRAGDRIWEHRHTSSASGVLHSRHGAEEPLPSPARAMRKSKRLMS